MPLRRQHQQRQTESAAMPFRPFEESAEALAHDDAGKTLKALTTIARNLYETPLLEKVRTLRLSNEAVKRNLLEYPAATDFLLGLGFVEVDGFLVVVGTEGDVKDTARAALEALAAVARSAHAHREYAAGGSGVLISTISGVFRAAASFARCFASNVCSYSLIARGSASLVRTGASPPSASTSSAGRGGVLGPPPLRRSPSGLGMEVVSRSCSVVPPL